MPTTSGPYTIAPTRKTTLSPSHRNTVRRLLRQHDKWKREHPARRGHVGRVQVRSSFIVPVGRTFGEYRDVWVPHNGRSTPSKSRPLWWRSCSIGVPSHNGRSAPSKPRPRADGSFAKYVPHNGRSAPSKSRRMPWPSPASLRAIESVPTAVARHRTSRDNPSHNGRSAPSKSRHDDRRRHALWRVIHNGRSAPSKSRQLSRVEGRSTATSHSGRSAPSKSRQGTTAATTERHLNPQRSLGTVEVETRSRCRIIRSGLRIPTTVARHRRSRDTIREIVD